MLIFILHEKNYNKLYIIKSWKVSQTPHDLEKWHNFLLINCLSYLCNTSSLCILAVFIEYPYME